MLEAGHLHVGLLSFAILRLSALSIPPFTNSIPLSVILLSATFLLPWILRKLARASGRISEGPYNPRI